MVSSIRIEKHYNYGKKSKDAAKNWATGYKMMELFVSRGDALFTEGAVHALASSFNEEMVNSY